MYRFFYPEFVRGRGALGLLALRVVMGTAFIQHGWGKIKDAFHWMDQMPNPPPGILQAVAAVSEFGGGAALILGVLTPLAALLLAGTMVGALVLVHLPAGHPFVGSPAEPHSFELPAVYLCCALMFLLVGPGVLSLDAWFFRRRARW